MAHGGEEFEPPAPAKAKKRKEKDAGETTQETFLVLSLGLHHRVPGCEEMAQRLAKKAKAKAFVRALSLIRKFI